MRPKREVPYDSNRKPTKRRRFRSLAFYGDPYKGNTPSTLVLNHKVAEEEMDVDKEWVEHLSNRMRDAVMTRIPDVTLNGDADKRYPGNLNFSFAYVEVRRCCCCGCCRSACLCCS